MSKSATTTAARGVMSRHDVAALLVILSGVCIAIGSAMPWFSLFAGLQPYRGTSGLYGQVVLGSGIAAVLAGAWLMRRNSRVMRNALITAGLLLCAFTAWLFVGLLDTYRTLLETPMYVAQLGPGLFLAMAGALMLTVTALFENVDRARRASTER